MTASKSTHVLTSARVTPSRVRCAAKMLLVFALLCATATAQESTWLNTRSGFVQSAADAQRASFHAAASADSPTDISGVINDYARIVSYDAVTATARLSRPVTFPCPSFALVIQMKGATIDQRDEAMFGNVLNINAAGSHEFVVMQSLAPGLVKFLAPLQRSYEWNAVVQLVSIPQFRHARVSAPLLAAPWDGENGGIIALLADTLTLNADIRADAAGFRGGAASVNGSFSSVANYFLDSASNKGGMKGEGVTLLPFSMTAARGKAANGGGGGNGHNSGGAGGGNGGVGGGGGFQHNGSGSGNFGGRGGTSLGGGNASDPRIYFGGGGGGGHQNDSRGTSGARGGGIVMLGAKVIYGNSHRISADGAAVVPRAGNDGAGGGGGGGSICIHADTIVDSVFLSVRGGKGGDVDNANNRTQCHGPGGGGGGGVVWHAGASLPAFARVTLDSGLSGRNVVYPSPCLNSPDGATDGKIGYTSPGFVMPSYRAPAFPLSASFDSSYRICDDSCVRLRPTIIGGIRPYRYVWTPPATLSSPSDSTPLACPDVTTTYLLTVTDSAGCTAIAQVTVNVEGPLNASLRRVCDTLVASPEGYIYRWYRNGVAIPADSTIPRIRHQGSGTYTVSITQPGGCTARPAALIVGPALTVLLPDTIELCPDSCAWLRPVIMNGMAPYRVDWTPRRAIRDSSGSAVLICPDSSLRYTVSITDSCGQGASAQVAVVLRPPPSLTLLRSGDTLTVWPAGLQYRWFRDGTEIPGERGYQMIARGSGEYVVEVRTRLGCTATAKVTVGPDPPPPLRVLLADSLFLCPDSCVILRPAVSGGAGPKQYAWTPAGGLSSTSDSTPVACPDSTTTYTVLVTDSLGRRDSARVTVRIDRVPMLSLEEHGDTLVAQPGGLVYRWYRDGVQISGASDQRLVATDSGMYRVEASTPSGCVAGVVSRAITRPPLFIVLPDSVRLCPDSCAVLFPFVSGGKRPYAYVWRPLAGLSMLSDSAAISCPDSTTEYEVVVTDARGDTTRTRIHVHVYARPVHTLVRRGDTLVVVPAGRAYRWWRNGRVVVGEYGRQLHVRVAGSYYAEVDSDEGCPSMTDSLDVRFQPPRVMMKDTLRICRDSCVTLAWSADGGLPPYVCTWQPAALVRSATDSSVTLCPDVSTLFTVTVVDDRGDTSIATCHVHVSLPPTVALVARGDTLTVQPPGYSCRWYRDGRLIPGASGDELLPDSSGVYGVEAVSPEGCVAMSPPYVFIRPPRIATVNLLCPSAEPVPPGAEALLRLRLTYPAGLTQGGAAACDVYVSAPAGVFIATESGIDETRGGDALMHLRVRASLDSAGGEILLPLRLKAALGPRRCVTFDIDSVSFIGTTALVDTRVPGCELCVAVCEEGGERLFDASVRMNLRLRGANPFNAATVIEYSLVERGHTRLGIVDVLGRHVVTLLDGPAEPGAHVAYFDASACASGLYFCVLQTPGAVRIITLLVTQ